MMDELRMLSGSELVARGVTRSDATLPEGGQKYITSSGSWLENQQVQSALEARKRLLEVERIEKSGSLSHATWRHEMKLAEVTKQTGSYWQYMGFNIGNKLYLNPEETVFLIEINCLLLKHDEVTVSLQNAYSLCLGDISLAQYKVYASLSRHGYKLLRPKPHARLRSNTLQSFISNYVQQTISQPTNDMPMQQLHETFANNERQQSDHNISIGLNEGETSETTNLDVGQQSSINLSIKGIVNEEGGISRIIIKRENPESSGCYTYDEINLQNQSLEYDNNATVSGTDLIQGTSSVSMPSSGNADQLNKVPERITRRMSFRGPLIDENKIKVEIIEDHDGSEISENEINTSIEQTLQTFGIDPNSESNIGYEIPPVDPDSDMTYDAEEINTDNIFNDNTIGDSTVAATEMDVDDETIGTVAATRENNENIITVKTVATINAFTDTGGANINQSNILALDKMATPDNNTVIESTTAKEAMDIDEDGSGIVAPSKDSSEIVATDNAVPRLDKDVASEKVTTDVEAEENVNIGETVAMINKNMDTEETTDATAAENMTTDHTISITKKDINTEAENVMVAAVNNKENITDDTICVTNINPDTEMANVTAVVNDDNIKPDTSIDEPTNDASSRKPLSCSFDKDVTSELSINILMETTSIDDKVAKTSNNTDTEEVNVVLSATEKNETATADTDASTNKNVDPKEAGAAATAVENNSRNVISVDVRVTVANNNNVVTEVVNQALIATENTEDMETVDTEAPKNKDIDIKEMAAEVISEDNNKKLDAVNIVSTSDDKAFIEEIKVGVAGTENNKDMIMDTVAPTNNNVNTEDVCAVIVVPENNENITVSNNNANIEEASAVLAIPENSNNVTTDSLVSTTRKIQDTKETNAEVAATEKNDNVTMDVATTNKNTNIEEATTVVVPENNSKIIIEVSDATTNNARSEERNTIVEVTENNESMIDDVVVTANNTVDIKEANDIITVPENSDNVSIEKVNVVVADPENMEKMNVDNTVTTISSTTDTEQTNIGVAGPENKTTDARVDNADMEEANAVVAVTENNEKVTAENNNADNTEQESAVSIVAEDNENTTGDNAVAAANNNASIEEPNTLNAVDTENMTVDDNVSDNATNDNSNTAEPSTVEESTDNDGNMIIDDRVVASNDNSNIAEPSTVEESTDNDGNMIIDDRVAAANDNSNNTEPSTVVESTDNDGNMIVDDRVAAVNDNSNIAEPSTIVEIAGNDGNVIIDDRVATANDNSNIAEPSTIVEIAGIDGNVIIDDRAATANDNLNIVEPSTVVEIAGNDGNVIIDDRVAAAIDNSNIVESNTAVEITSSDQNVIIDDRVVRANDNSVIADPLGSALEMTGYDENMTVNDRVAATNDFSIAEPNAVLEMTENDENMTIDDNVDTSHNDQNFYEANRYIAATESDTNAGNDDIMIISDTAAIRESGGLVDAVQMEDGNPDNGITDFNETLETNETVHVPTVVFSVDDAGVIRIFDASSMEGEEHAPTTENNIQDPAPAVNETRNSSNNAISKLEMYVIKKMEKLTQRKYKSRRTSDIEASFITVPDCFNQLEVTATSPHVNYLPRNIFLHKTSYVLNVEAIKNLNAKNCNKDTDDGDGNPSDIRRPPVIGNTLPRGRRASQYTEPPRYARNQPNHPNQYPRYTLYQRYLGPMYWRPRQAYNMYYNYNPYTHRPQQQNYFTHPRYRYPQYRHHMNYNQNRPTTSGVNNQSNQRKRDNPRVKAYHLQVIRSLAERFRIYAPSQVQDLVRLLNSYNAQHGESYQLTQDFSIVNTNDRDNVQEVIVLDDDGEPKSKKQKMSEDDEKFNNNLNKLKALAAKLKDLEMKKLSVSRHRRVFSNAIKTFNKTFNADIHLDSNFEIIDSKLITLDSSSDSDSVVAVDDSPRKRKKKLRNPFTILKRGSGNVNEGASTSRDVPILQQLSLNVVNVGVSATDVDTDPAKDTEGLLKYFDKAWLPGDEDFGKAELCSREQAHLLNMSEGEYLYEFFKDRTVEFQNWLELKISFLKQVQENIKIKKEQADALRNDFLMATDPRIQPLVGPDCTDIQSVLAKLRIIPPNKEPAASGAATVNYDVYFGHNPSFRKSNPPKPDFRVICVDNTDDFLTGQAVDSLCSAQSSDGIQNVIAIVNGSSISYLQVNNTELSEYIPDVYLAKTSYI